MGANVAITPDGNTVAAAAYRVTGGSDNASAQLGAVYIFTKPSGGWANETEAAKLTQDGPAGYFMAMSSDGNTVISAGKQSPSIFVFHKTQGTTWASENNANGVVVNTAILTTSNGGNLNGSNDRTIAISNDGSTIVLGVANQLGGSGGFNNAGAIYVFEEPISGGWVDATETAELTALDGAASDGLATCIALSSNGSTIVAGAMGSTRNGQTMAGAVYVFVKGTGWTSGSTNQAAEFAGSSMFAILGWDVAITPDGNTIVADDMNMGFYAFAKPSGGWSGVTNATTPTISTTAMGPTLATNNDASTIAMGDAHARVGSYNNAGDVLIYNLSLGFTLSVSKTGAGTGSVSSTPAGIDCGSTCSALLSGSVTLTATADNGSIFTGWSGDCTGATCVLDMTAAKNVTANFVVAKTLGINKSGNGTVTASPSGISCGSTCSSPYAVNAVVSLSATADPGYTFTGWTGACSGTGTCKVRLAANQAATATFTAVTPPSGNKTLTVTKALAGTGTGSIVSSPSGINCGSTCNYDFAVNSVVSLTATPDAGNTFAGWTGACSGTGTCKVRLAANQTATATFNSVAAPTGNKTLTITKAGTATGTVASNPAGISCGETCEYDFAVNALVKLSATPDAGKHFTGWSGACTGTGTCQIRMLDARSVTATFN